MPCDDYCRRYRCETCHHRAIQRKLLVKIPCQHTTTRSPPSPHVVLVDKGQSVGDAHVHEPDVGVEVHPNYRGANCASTTRRRPGGGGYGARAHVVAIGKCGVRAEGRRVVGVSWLDQEFLGSALQTMVCTADVRSTSRLSGPCIRKLVLPRHISQLLLYKVLLKVEAERRGHCARVQACHVGHRGMRIHRRHPSNLEAHPLFCRQRPTGAAVIRLHLEAVDCGGWLWPLEPVAGKALDHPCVEVFFSVASPPPPLSCPGGQPEINAPSILP